MATARSFWKGHLRLALVTIPIRLVSATASEDKIALHQIDKKSKQRIRYQKVAGESGKVVPQSVKLPLAIVEDPDFKDGENFYADQSDNFFVGNAFPTCGINFTAQEIMGQTEANQ